MLKKTTILIAICLNLAPVCIAQKVKDGFKGHAWGTALADIDKSLGLRFATESEGYAVYMTSIDSLGGAELEWCGFTFYRGRFMGVSAKTQGQSDWDILLVALKKVYGQPTKDNPYLENYRWLTSKSLRRFEQSIITKEGLLTMQSVKITLQIEEEKKNKGR